MEGIHKLEPADRDREQDEKKAGSKNSRTADCSLHMVLSLFSKEQVEEETGLRLGFKPVQNLLGEIIYSRSLRLFPPSYMLFVPRRSLSIPTCFRNISKFLVNAFFHRRTRPIFILEQDFVSFCGSFYWLRMLFSTAI